MTDEARTLEPHSLIERFFSVWIGGVQRHATLTLVIAVVLALGSLYLMATRMGFKTTRTDLVDPTLPSQRYWQRYVAEFGDELDIVVVVEGNDRRRMTQAIEVLASDIKAFPQHFEKLCYKIDVGRLRAKGLFQLSLAELSAIKLRVESLRPLLIGAWNWLTTQNIFSASQFMLRQLPGDRPFDERTRVTLAGTTTLLSSMTRWLEAGVFQSPWQHEIADHAASQLDRVPDYFFSQDGSLVFLRVMPKRDPTSFNGHQRAVELIRAIVAHVGRRFHDLEFGVTGLPVLENDEMSAAQTASTWSTLLSVVGVGLLCIAGFRALRHPLFLLLTLVIAACWSIGFLTLTIGHLNILSSAFLITLIGLGIDYGILWLTRYESLLAAGFSDASAGRKTACEVAPSLLTGCLTTALAFFTTLLTGFLGLVEMGWIAGWGILFCLLATVTVLPALLTLAGCPNRRLRQSSNEALPAFAGWHRRPWLALGLAAGIVLGMAWEIPRLQVDCNLLNLQQSDVPSVHWEHKLIARTGTSGWYAVALVDSPERAREIKRQFEQLPSVGRVIEMASLIPLEQDRKQPIIQEIHRDLRALPPRDMKPNLARPRVELILAQLADLEQPRSHVLPAERQQLELLARAAGQLRAALLRLAPVDQERRLAEFEHRYLRDLIEQLHRMAEAATPSPVTQSDIPTVLAERFISPHGKWLVQIFAKHSVWDLAPLRAFCEDLQRVDPQVTGKPVATLFAMSQMMNGYRDSAGMALLVIALLVWLDFRDLANTLLAMIPLGFGALCMFGMMAAAGIALNPANVIALPLILGIGIDYGVHAVHDFRLQQRGGYVFSRRLARALFLSGSTTVVGFASLLTARHWGMQSIGLVLAIGVGSCLFTVEFLLPVLLGLLDRKRQPLVIHRFADPVVRPARRAA